MNPKALLLLPLLPLVTLRSIDPADQDFSDLMPLVQVLGKARVVQLGEATHGDGATFLAKARLIRFRLVETIDRRRDELLVRYPPREIDYIRQTLVSLMAMDRALGPGDRPAFEGGYTRDTAMAENLLWWLNGPLEGRKVVVWAHNYHVMDDFFSTAVSEEMRKSTRGPMGRLVKEALGSDLYTIGFTSFSGSWLDLETGKPVPVKPGDLETDLHGLKRPWLFVPADRWSGKPMSASLYFNEPSQVIDWSRVYDGIFYIDVQTPATPLK